jgi:hypothetical protein
MIPPNRSSSSRRPERSAPMRDNRPPTIYSVGFTRNRLRPTRPSRNRGQPTGGQNERNARRSRTCCDGRQWICPEQPCCTLAVKWKYAFAQHSPVCSSRPPGNFGSIRFDVWASRVTLADNPGSHVCLLFSDKRRVVDLPRLQVVALLVKYITPLEGEVGSATALPGGGCGAPLYAAIAAALGNVDLYLRAAYPLPTPAPKLARTVRLPRLLRNRCRRRGRTRVAPSP